MGKKYIIKYNRSGCIGAGVCVAVNYEFWSMVETKDDKADIKKIHNPIILENGDQELEIDEKDLPLNLEAAQGCPVNVIHIYEKDTGKKIV